MRPNAIVLSLVGKVRPHTRNPYLLDKRSSLTALIAETHLAYNRVALTEYFQHRSVEKLYLNDGGYLS